MSSVCLADVQDFWILLWIIFFTVMITACLEVLSQTEIYNSWMLLFSYRWLIIFDLLLLHTCFPLDVGGSGRLHENLNKKINKYFMCVTINKMTKGNIVFVIPVRINYCRTRQYV